MNENICPQYTIPSVPVDILRIGLNFLFKLKREFEFAIMKTQKEIMHEGEFILKLTIMRMHEAIYTQHFHTNKMTAASHNFSFRHKPQISDSRPSNMLFST